MAVSRKLTPRSSAACTSAIDCASLRPAPSPMRLLPPQPSPATPTLSPVLPSVVYCIDASRQVDENGSTRPLTHQRLVAQRWPIPSCARPPAALSIWRHAIRPADDLATRGME